MARLDWNKMENLSGNNVNIGINVTVIKKVAETVGKAAMILALIALMKRVRSK